jgi:hypothetical protein
MDPVDEARAMIALRNWQAGIVWEPFIVGVTGAASITTIACLELLIASIAGGESRS